MIIQRSTIEILQWPPVFSYFTKTVVGYRAFSAMKIS